MTENRLSTEAGPHIPLGYDTQCRTKVFVEIIARALVDEPEWVSVSEIDGMHTSILELKVSKTDIGKQGRTANALRILLGAVSAKEKKRTMLEIMD